MIVVLNKIDLLDPSKRDTQVTKVGTSVILGVCFHNIWTKGTKGIFTLGNFESTRVGSVTGVLMVQIQSESLEGALSEGMLDRKKIVAIYSPWYSDF